MPHTNPPPPPSGLRGLVEALKRILCEIDDRLVFVDGVPHVHAGDEATATSVLALVGLEPAAYRVYLENACDPEHSCELDECPRIVRHGYRFHTSPRDGNLGRGEGPRPAPLADQLRELEAAGHTVTVTDAGSCHVVVISDVTLPEGLGGGRETVMFLVPKKYPRAALDNFYLPERVTGASALFAQRANRLESHGGATWRRVSWHLTTPWPPEGMSLTSYLAWTREGLSRIA